MLIQKLSAASKVKMLVFIPLALVCLECCSKNDFPQKGNGAIVNIKYTGNREPQKNLANRKYQDIEVYRLDHNNNFITFGPEAPKEESNFYEIFFYGKAQDSPFCSSVGYGSNETMDKATYQWLNDSLVSVCLYNSISKKEINFKVFGNSHGSGMIHW